MDKIKHARLSKSAICGSLIGLLSLSENLSAQTQADAYRQQLDRIRRETLLQAQQDIPTGQRTFFDYGAYLTLNYLSVDDSNQDNRSLRQVDFIGYARLNVDGVHDVFLRFRENYRDFSPGDSFDGRGDNFSDPDMDIAYYRFDLARYLGAYKGQDTDGDLVFQVGRDIVYWGNGLALGAVLDGASLTFRTGDFYGTVIAGVTPVRTVDFVDASRPDFDFNTRRGYYGLMLGTRIGDHRPYAYYLIQQDYNKDETYDLGNVVTRYGYDSYYLGIGSNGNFGDKIAYGAEVVYEGGSGNSNSVNTTPSDSGGSLISQLVQQKQSISAFAADLRIDYLPQDQNRSRLSAEFLVASGDDDRINSSTDTFGGNTANSLDKAYNAFALINAGQSFAPSISNLLMARFGVSTFPLQHMRATRGLQVGADVFVYGKTDSDAPIDEPTNSGGYLGWEPDFYVNWQATSDVTFAVRYGVFFPSTDAFEDDSARQFFSTSVTFAF